MAYVIQENTGADIFRIEPKTPYSTDHDTLVDLASDEQAENARPAIKDDMAEILEKMHWADVIVMASPVYFYSIDAQMKTVIDRTVAQWTQIKNKEFYYIMAAAEESSTVMDCTLECFRGLAACLSGSKEMGVIYGKGVYEAGAIKNMPVMKEAYERGKEV